MSELREAEGLLVAGVDRELGAESKLVRLFVEFHRKNPEVYRHLLRFARGWWAQHRKKVGIAMLFERARWELAFETGFAPKLNNNHRAYYARLLMLHRPELEGLFVVRRLGHREDHIVESMEVG